MDTGVIGGAATLPMGNEASDPVDTKQTSRDDSEAAKAFEAALRRRDAQRKRHEVSPGEGQVWQTLVHADPRLGLPTSRAEHAAVDLEHASNSETAQGDAPSEVHARSASDAATDRVARALTLSAARGSHSMTPPPERVDATATPPTVIHMADATPAHRKPVDRHSAEASAPEGMPAWGIAGHAARDTASMMAPLPHDPRGHPGHTPRGGEPWHAASTGGDGMRYAFGSWGKGHFVNVQAVQVDGQRRFVLGASDALVQRRLQAMWPSTGAGGSSRWQLNGAGVSIVTGVAPVEDATQEEPEC
ncbi:hypothetical protein PPN31114_02289 [Pandoraea pneumonica]|uniref:Surface presentation of antigen domain-containing protein n=1 Tax=Pandoraea pneumonica TaxID=2508299 RepID=A0A5E4UWD0_9BURK|nr:hypothetical protein [Pandoraea pneumonica]VVE04216.1 hypothetical protein PPN31114_02289 [Pandoraea pneumonica]